MHAELQSPELCRVRAITAFTVLPADAASWESILSEAKSQCDRLAASLDRGGYQVQSIRIVSNPFGEYLDTSDIAASKAGLERIRNILTRINQNSSLRIRFAIGEACTAAEIALLPELIKDYGDLCNACVNVHADANCLPDNETILRCVEAVGTIGRITPRGDGNFNFTVLLAAALRRLNNLPKEHTAYFQTALNAMREALQHHVDAVQQYIIETPLSAGWQYAGMDTSAAPSKNCTSMVELYRLLRVPHFGAAGTVEASALLTRVFKSLHNVRAVGFSGLMLAVTEDQGLAEATHHARFGLHDLLTYSSVCGIGLDTVPIPGDTPAGKIAAIMRDTGTMAFRLNKPLTVRVFPVPGLQAGERTTFESADLCNCAVLPIR